MSSLPRGRRHVNAAVRVLWIFSASLCVTFSLRGAWPLGRPGSAGSALGSGSARRRAARAVPGNRLARFGGRRIGACGSGRVGVGERSARPRLGGVHRPTLGQVVSWPVRVGIEPCAGGD